MKKILPALVLVALIGGGIGYYQWNKPHQNMESAAADLTMEATALFAAFEADENAANAAYLDKIIQVSGTVITSSIGEDGLVKVTLDSGDAMFGVICELDALATHQRTQFLPGEPLTVKGKCSGKLMDVVLVRCVEI